MASVIRGNSLYSIVDGPSWTQAEANAVKLGGHLVTIEDRDEDIFLWENTSRLPSLYGDWQNLLWIGLTDQREEGLWEWISGSTSNYRNWSGLPDDSHGGQDYAWTNWYGLSWDDGGGPGATWERAGGIAEIPVSPSITLPTAPKEGAGVFTTSINLFAGTTTSGNLANGTTVYWKVTGITADDLTSSSPNALTGSGVISNGKLDIQHSLVQDADTGEKFEVSVFSDSALTQQIGTTASTAIQENTPLATKSGITVKSTSSNGITTEQGGTATYSFVLDKAPTANVTLTFAVSDTTEAKASSSTLVFTPSNWSSVQSLTITGIDDVEDDGDTAYNLTTKVSSADPSYGQRRDGTGGVAVANINLINKDDGLDKDLTIYGDVAGSGVIDDLLRSGNGKDRLYGKDGRDQLYGGSNDDRLYGGYDDDYLYGEDGNDQLFGEQDDDVLTGGKGNDSITGGEGADQLIGGEGNDTYIIDDGLDTIDDQGLTTDIDQVIIRGNFTSFILSKGLENVSLDSSSTVANVTGNDSANTLNGNDQNNALNGGAGNDSVNGGNGNDSLAGGLGNDAINGGDGTDTADYSGTTGVVNVNLTSGTASGALGTDTLTAIENAIGGVAADSLTGSAGNNNLSGGGGNDSLNGGAGNDSLNGGDGTDTADYSAATGAVTINLTTGTATGSLGADTLSAIENATGGSAADSLTGSTANNALSGGAGNDSLNGGLGADALTGQAGADRFTYTALNASLLSGVDRITDLAIGTDAIDSTIAVTAVNLRELGTISALTQAGVSAVLTTSTFVANGAATFTFGTGAGVRTFLALNDGTAGFSSTTDAVIEITGFSGALTSLAVV